MSAAVFRRLVPLVLLTALALHVALGYRDAGPTPLPLDAAALDRAKAMSDAERRREFRAILALERAAAPKPAEPRTDPRLAEAALRLAVLAEADFPPAAWRLGWYYINGWGVERDRCTAVEWLHRAARRGEANAQFWLALAYLPPNGRGVAADKLAAFQWASAARAQDLPIAVELFHFFTQDFSPEERAAAEASLASWSAGTAAAPVARRFPYVPLLVGLWPRQTHHVMPCRQPLAPFEDWPPE